MHTKTIQIDRRGQVPATSILVGAVVLALLMASALVFVFITGTPVGFQAGGIILPTDDGGIGSSQNPSLEVSLSEPITGEAVEGTISLFKIGAGARDPDCPVRCRISKSTTSNGSVSLSNLSPQQEYLLEVETLANAQHFYPVTLSKTTAISGSVSVPVQVTSQNNGAATFSVFNDDDKTANTTSARQPIGANDSKSFNFIIQFAATQNDNNFFGLSSLGNLIVVDANRDLIQRLSGVDAGGDLTCMSAPTAHNAVDANRTKSFACVTNVTRARAKFNHEIQLTFDTTAIDPTDLADQNGAFWLTMYDSCRILNTQTGLYEDNWFNPVTLADICTTEPHNAGMFFD